MPQERKTFAILASAAIFILMEVAALAMLKSSSVLQNIWINRASHRVMASLWKGEEKIRSHFSLDSRNSELAEENARLNEELRQFRMREEAANEAAAAVSGSHRFRYIPATVVKMSRNSAHNYIIINKGSEDGVVPQSGIITDKGVVGIINAVDRHYSYGLTLMNTNVKISTRIGAEGITAPLVWNGAESDGAYVNDIPPHYEINPGDTVWTSGYSTIFPADIPVGVTRGSRLVDGSTRQLEVTLFQDFSTLRYVTVVENMERAEIQALEASGAENESRR